MPIRELEPVDPTVDHWRRNTWVAAVFVRANNELVAREVAQSAFGIAAEKPPSAEAPSMPWVNEWISTCERVEDSEYDEEGSDDILGPEEALVRVYSRPG